MKAWKAVLTVLALVLAFASIAIAQESPPLGVQIASTPNPKPGSWWLLKTWNSDLEVQLIRVELKIVEVGNLIVKFGESEVVFTPEWNMLRESHPSAGLTTKYSPSLLLFSFPFWPGKTWGSPVITNTEGGFVSGRAEFPTWGQSTEWQQVTVPAGTFRAIRLDMRLAIAKIICWYAPEAQYFARCISPDNNHPQYNFDLAAFEVGGKKGD